MPLELLRLTDELSLEECVQAGVLLVAAVQSKAQ